MEHKYNLILIIGLTSLSVAAIIFLAVFCLLKRKAKNVSTDTEAAFGCKEEQGLIITGDLIKFQGGEDLSVQEILEAPGEVIGKSSYGTLYRACLANSNSLTLLRFLRPTCTLRIKEVMPIVELLGSIRHPNLVPLNAFYAGPRGEKLMVHPFYGNGNLAQFIRDATDSNGEAHQWPTICKISIGIARGLYHLHTSPPKPVIHGNLKSKNILLDRHHNPYVSDFGLHLLVNLSAGQQMLELSASEGYKPPELIKMKDACEESDIYGLGVILLELLTGKEPIDSAMRRAILDDRIVDLYHPDILVGLSEDRRVVVEDGILRYFQLAMACCSPSRPLRPDMKQIVDRLEEIGM
ncbi:putative kinase-like protein tmkl1 [Phtheirospermum japonicum]|uniref:Putative kinase-like protein tmkl1 n=1 Tax=Phtheirospermum japonicum TaxID=374723 RepID=A0A830CTP9_9LAMI|nr:putative kinase-like protein tmkl1 [Phtheirospermum japonicum]